MLANVASNCKLFHFCITNIEHFSVLEPLIDHVCDPIWINEQLVQYLRQQQVAEELGKRTYHYAASYEDFITLIHESTDVNELNHLK